MNRRDFLKLAGLLSTALIFQFEPLGKVMRLPVEAQAGGKAYRGTIDGKIFISENAGKTWQIHTDFGSDFSVLELLTDVHENIHAYLGFSGYSFQLTCSPNNKVWRTA
jgi:hypothetical protein